MKYRFFKPLEERISLLAFGTWAIGGVSRLGGSQAGWGPVDDRESVRALRRALELGVTFFDTADVYGKGHSERLLGKTLRGHLDARVCTKFGIRESRRGPVFKDFSAPYLRKCVDESLERLKRDHIDVLLLHSPPDDFEWSTYDRTGLEALKKAGKIRCYGVSCRSVAGAKHVLRHRFGEVLEVIYNVLDRRAEALFPQIVNRGMGLLARVPLASGFLSSKCLNSVPRFPKTDYRAYLKPDEIAWRRKMAKRLQFLEAEKGGMAAAALRFCANSEAVTSVLAGMRSVEQVDHNVAAFAGRSLPLAIANQIRRTVPCVYRGWRK